MPRLNLDEHGGGCCGAAHLWGFPHISPKRKNYCVTPAVAKDMLKRGIERFMEDNLDDYPRLGLIEVILTDGQLDNGWKKILEDEGFVHHRRWLNSNSDNFCNLYTYVSE